ncbi:MAG TPA: glycosyltransferase family 39 protein [Gemmatimonadales bacterium]|nr:glycosyltransferase family 39 protein [Gemmatimonadales bacterium]
MVARPAPERTTEAAVELPLAESPRAARGAPDAEAGARPDIPAGPRWELPAIILLALSVRLAHLDHPPHFDELYHALAARSWVADGSLRIADGTYTRASLFTVLIGAFYRLLGDSLVVARLPSVLAGTAWVGAIFVWTRREIGRGAAWGAALLFAIDPGAVNLSQQARFYALHGLLFWLGAAAVYAAVTRPGGRRAWARWPVAALLLGVALHLQQTTLIGLAALGSWVAAALVLRLPPPRRLRRSAAALGAGMVALAALAQTETGRELWRLYRYTALWASAQESNVRWYADWLMARYPVLWALLPMAALTALARRRAPAAFCLTVFTLALLLHSFAGFKQERFIYYALPFFFVVWGIALAALAPGFVRLARRLAGRPPSHADPASHPAGRVMVVGLVAGCVGFAAYANSAVVLGVRMVFPEPGRRPYQEADWGAAAPRLAALADSVEVVVTSAGPKAQYFVGRFDYGLSATELMDYGRDTPEFVRDPRTGRPLISQVGSIERVMSCHATGLAIVEQLHWGRRWSVPPDVAEYVAAHADSVALPPAWGLLVYRWREPASVPSEPCPPDAAELSSRTRAGAPSAR